MQKTVKQICEEQGILGQIILERWEKHFLDVDSKANSFSKCISDIATLEGLDKRLAFDRLYNMIAEEEFKPKSLAEQYIESSELRESVEKMQVSAEQPSKLAKEIMNSFEGVSIEPKSISKGSIVTIDGKEYELQGDAVLVEPIKELIQGKRYLIGYSGQFCHSNGEINVDMLEEKPVDVFFIGEITLANNSKRNIFYHQDRQGTYFMFGTTRLDYIIKQLD